MRSPTTHTFYLKIAIITVILLGFLQVLNSYSQSWESEVHIENTNADIYQSASSHDYWVIGVALSTRIGIAFQDGLGQNSSSSFYGEITTIGTTDEEKKAVRSQMIAQNMLIMQEYLNLSRTDIKTLLSGSNDRKSTLEWFISQLEMRYKNSALSLTNLEKQKDQLLTYLWEIEINIETVKLSMEDHFAAAQASSTLADVDEYFTLRSEYTQAFTDIVFINQFIKQHAFLNNYNKWILDTLINNKEAIINQSYVVIPDSWDQYLRPLELIFDEAEIKSN